MSEANEAYVMLERLRKAGVSGLALRDLGRLEKRLRSAERELARRGKLLDELREELLLRRGEQAADLALVPGGGGLVH